MRKTKETFEEKSARLRARAERVRRKQARRIEKDLDKKLRKLSRDSGQ